MKILFLISADGGNAAGGHFNSLNQISREVANTNEVSIITLGKHLSPVLEKNPFFKMHLNYSNSLIDIFKLNKRLKNYFKLSHYPDVVHCFDTGALNRSLLCSVLSKIPLVLNKCGGPNPSRNNYQHADSIVAFSGENYKWYVENKNYKNDSIFLIPNRVRKLSLANVAHNEKASPEKITFVRISRLGGAYDMTLLQTFNLIKELSKTLKVELFVIGKIINEQKFKHLKAVGDNLNIDVKYITDQRALKASEFLYLADFVIGTGRSFMEATSLGIPTLTPAKNSDIPIYVNKSNVENFLHTNFSERNTCKLQDVQNTINTIKILSKNKEKFDKASEETESIFAEYFGTDMINDKYSKVYSYSVNNKTSRVYLCIKNMSYLTRFIFRGY